MTDHETALHASIDAGLRENRRFQPLSIAPMLDGCDRLKTDLPVNHLADARMVM